MGKVLRNIRSMTPMSRVGGSFLKLPMGYTENFFHLFSWAGYAEDFSLQIVLLLSSMIRGY
jgi:hypothetical protein